MWILESALLDILFFVLPVIGSVLLFYFTGIDFDQVAIVGILIFTWIDSGHIFMTSLRTYFNPSEYDANKNLYVYAPILIFVVMSSWLILGGKFLWDFVMYTTIYHNVRQYYGVTRWYQKNINSKSIWQTRFLYLLTLIPVLLFHFRSNIPKALYGKTDLASYDNPVLLQNGFYLYFSVIGVWLVYQAFTLYRNKREFATSLSVLVPAIGYGAGFLYGTTVFQMAAPIIVGHGVGYWALMSVSLQRTQAEKFKSFGKVLLVTMMIAVIVGSISDVIEQNYLEKYMYSMAVGWNHIVISLAVALVLTPLFLHYYVDALIWSKKHRESHLVYKIKS